MFINCSTISDTEHYVYAIHTVYGDIHLKYLLGSIARVRYCILVPDFYLVLHGLRCRKKHYIGLTNQSTVLPVRIIGETEGINSCRVTFQFKCASHFSEFSAFCETNLPNFNIWCETCAYNIHIISIIQM